MGIPMTHPDLDGAETTAVDEDQAAVLEQSGWQRKPEPKTTRSTEKKGS